MNKPNIHRQDIRYQVYQNFDKYDQVATVENPENTLNILKTCHSLHDEGSPELYSTNIFAFHRPEAFRCFLARRTPNQLSRLAVSFTRLKSTLGATGYLGGFHWDKTLMEILSDWLGGLRSIYLHTEVCSIGTAIDTTAGEIFLDLDDYFGETLDGEFSRANEALKDFLRRIEMLIRSRGIRVKNIPMTTEVRVDRVVRDDSIYQRAHAICHVRNSAESQQELVGMRDKILGLSGSRVESGVESGETEGGLQYTFKVVPKIFFFYRPLDFDKKGPGTDLGIHPRIDLSIDPRNRNRR
jgi:hypothetical protein